ncbi:MAG: aminoacyl-tRNA hydrolase [Patescibacteria group bacterium]|jgi:PTH1 family peptidyl-tRNA hydrolase|nr:aminoacyl-tRNA hydrolase [Patescibacteria group bacterium]MDD3777781.1 aminoacyl-tRNA hydrolase [Patescibacteria group bacterium]MDD3939449.1 aminoacyl-tRNA hydrolase [Patescibacteria group bacterium]MDD4443528.1 aminoacyl-tRNA hydrolase [Patescibacteria group bacterium]NCU39486.1 aminoacyl-tRNA hydrolase [Candidatus Falkowbacteria bacterium]
MKIIVALGNPGNKYEKSRHNAGWFFLDNLLKNATWQEEKKFKALIYKDANTFYVKPLTYMNLSGESVRKILDFYGLIPKRLGLFTKKEQDLSEILTVVHDDLDLDFGKIKVIKNSRSAGHHGIDSIIKHLKTKNFTRIKIGIKNEFLKKHIPPEKFVLQNFSQQEQEMLKDLFSKFQTKNPLI